MADRVVLHPRFDLPFGLRPIGLAEPVSEAVMPGKIGKALLERRMTVVAITDNGPRVVVEELLRRPGSPGNAS